MIVKRSSEYVKDNIMLFRLLSLMAPLKLIPGDKVGFAIHHLGELMYVEFDEEHTKEDFEWGRL
jgi:hypothetical protein